MSERLPHPLHEDRWADGTVRLGNQVARTDGVRQFETRGDAALPADLRVSVDEFKTQVVRDRGGVETLTAIEGGYVRRLTELETVARLLASDISQRGLFTQKGRVRSTLTKWLETLDRWDRFAQRVGPERRPRKVPTLAEVLSGDE